MRSHSELSFGALVRKHDTIFRRSLPDSFSERDESYHRFDRTNQSIRSRDSLGSMYEFICPYEFILYEFIHTNSTYSANIYPQPRQTHHGMVKVTCIAWPCMNYQHYMYLLCPTQSLLIDNIEGWVIHHPHHPVPVVRECVQPLLSQARVVWYIVGEAVAVTIGPGPPTLIWNPS